MVTGVGGGGGGGEGNGMEASSDGFYLDNLGFPTRLLEKTFMMTTSVV